ncbi:Ribophorin I [Linderina pennispora]|uniref:Dolichyl-diphosphooligosaccharide--protein glycosyltransferase subunit 1 n=1 Tax=Linderina pennispora TaxID=61395 RepID=A0A1Y1WE42_9FUNG|nr:Ribophorin I [Linderina pennispora]ORX71799.1 Ribophorin I [Linderina pennispora]
MRFLVAGSLYTLSLLAAASGLVHTNLIRTVDLTSAPFIREQIGAVVQNEHASKQYKSYTIAVPASKHAHLASLTVHERKSGVELPTVPLDFDTKRNAYLYRATLRAPLAPNDKLSLNVDMTLSRFVSAKPAVMEPADDQQWVWEDRALVPSVYETRKQKTVVNAPRVTRHTGVLQRKSVVFGPFNATAEDGPAEVAFRSNKEQAAAVHRREYFVSHLGDDLNVLEHYQLKSLAPRPPQYDKVRETIAKFMRTRDNFIKTLLVPVPVTARDMYYVDEIGNVSTSAVTSPREAHGQEFRILQLKPRYPLSGGDQYTWWHGYSLPLHAYLRRQGARHFLKVPFIGHIAASASGKSELTVDMAVAENVAVESYELHVTLPEGATDIDVRAPVRAEIAYEPTWYYLDSTGRTTVVVSTGNVAPGDLGDVLVMYSYSAVAVWQKPAVVALMVFGVFAVAMAVGRVRFGLAQAANKKKSA